MNGDDYVIIEEKHAETIIEEYCKTLDIDDVPIEFRMKWVQSYLENGRDEDE